MPVHEIRQASLESDIPLVRELFKEYEASLGADLEFQGFAKELAELPGFYSPPAGAILLCHVDGEPAGCVGMRPYNSDVCEMKRLFVRDRFRGQGLGKMLVESVVQEARKAGYLLMRLDTLQEMQDARKLYGAFGFLPIPAYYDNPLEGVEYLELDLAPK